MAYHIILEVAYHKEKLKTQPKIALAGLGSMKWHAVSGILATCQRKLLNGSIFVIETSNFLNSILNSMSYCLDVPQSIHVIVHQNVNESKHAS